MVCGILFGSRIFLKVRFPFPFWKALSSYGLDGHKDVHEYFRGKLLAMVCKLENNLCSAPSCLCFYGQVLSFFIFWVCFFLCHCHSFHCDCSANARLKKMSFLFYCIILPCDLVMLTRISYNVDSAKSVLFCKVCNLL